MKRKSKTVPVEVQEEMRKLANRLTALATTYDVRINVVDSNYIGGDRACYLVLEQVDVQRF